MTIHKRYKALSMRHQVSLSHLIAIAMTLSAATIETMSTESLLDAFGPGEGKLKIAQRKERKRQARLEQYIEVRSKRDKALRQGRVDRGGKNPPTNESA